MAKIDFSVPPVMPENEMSNRLCNFRREMQKQHVDVLILASYENFEYLAGHYLFGWELNAARPIYAIVTAEDLIVVCTRSEERLFSLGKQQDFDEVYYMGFQKEATKAVIDVVKKYDSVKRKTIAIDYGPEITGIGNLDLVDGLRAMDEGTKLVSAAPIVWNVRKHKSEYEAELKRRAFAISHLAFDHAVEAARAGITEKEMQRLIKHALIDYGAERVDCMYLTFGTSGFVFNKLPGNKALQEGEYVWADFFNTYEGYASDTCRIARCGEASQQERDAYRTVLLATTELCKSVKIGMTGGEIFENFERIWEGTKLPPIMLKAGRIGHGSGRNILEPFSVAKGEGGETVEPGMILHFEPKLEAWNGVFQFEEVIYVREDGVEFLTPAYNEELPIVRIS